MIRRALLVSLLSLPLVASAAAAGGPGAEWWREFDVRRGSFTFVTENDKYFAGTDRHYTNGLKLIWLGETTLDRSQHFLQNVARFVPTLRDNAEHQRYKVGLSLGQNIYTPGDTEATVLLPRDRPYAGWLYGSMLLQAQERDGSLLRVVELSVGVVGPSALGRQAQNGFHDLINVPHAQGWDNQLHDEPALMLSWERRYRLATLKTGGGRRWADAIGRGRLTLGNVHTHLAAGGLVRLGWNLPRDFGTDLIRPAGGGMANAGSGRRFAAYSYLSAEVRAVGRNIFLDGNSWQASHSVRKRPVMADLSAGLVFAWPRFQLTYTQDYRTKEFYGQAKRDVFGSIAFTSFH